MKIDKLLSSLLVALCLIIPNWANAITSPATIEKAVKRHVNQLLASHKTHNNPGQRVEFTVTRIDPNLRMATCGSALQLTKNEARMVGRVSIKVRCEGPKPWQIYVPVTIKAYQKVVTASAPLARDQRLDSTVLSLSEKEVSQLTQGFFSSIREVSGKSLKRPVQANSVIQPHMIIEPLVIKRGDEVMILAQSGALSVKSPGIAVTKGRIGQQIQVKNKSSSRVVTARVINSKLVQVVM